MSASGKKKPATNRPKLVSERAGANIRVRIANVSPEDAAHMLEGNTGNRALRARHVTDLAGAMKRPGEWQLNAETIKISATGRVLDGQHRLHAVIEAGVSVMFMIVEGLPDETFKTIDLNSVRKPHDSLKVAGRAYYSQVASIARAVMAYDAYGDPQSGPKVSPSQVVEWDSAHGDIAEDVAAMVHSMQKGLRTAGVRPTAVMFVMFLVRRDGSDDDFAVCHDFFDAVASGVGMGKGHPGLPLVSRLRAASMASAKMPTASHFRLVASAWNAAAKGESRAKIQVPAAMPVVRAQDVSLRWYRGVED